MEGQRRLNIDRVERITPRLLRAPLWMTLLPDAVQ